MFTFILEHLPIFRVVAILTVFFTYSITMVHKGVVYEENKQQKQQVKDANIAAKIEAKNATASDKDLEKRMQKWYRD